MSDDPRHRLPADDATFDLAFSRVVALEGGSAVSDDPADPGGLTRWGISQRAYPALDVSRLTRADAKAIYRRDYWQAVGGDALPPAVAVVVFDGAVNQGVAAAASDLQRSLDVAVDGIVGPVTAANAASAAARDLPALLSEILSRRAVRYAGTMNFGRFGRGWMRRLFVIHAAALSLTRKT